MWRGTLGGTTAEVRPAIAPRIAVEAPGTVDADYRGEVQVILVNLGTEPFKIERGARIAQMVLAPVLQATICEAANLDETSRGVGGFGSTGTGRKS